MTYCELRKDRFGIFTVPEGMTPQQAVNWKKRVLAANTSYGALYYPHITILDPLTDKALNIPCGGHVAGVYAKTDQVKTVGDAPAGMATGKLGFLIGLERSLQKEHVGDLNSNDINCLIDWPQTGRVVWGARTLELAGEFTYVSQRRLFMFLEKSAYLAGHVYVFESNTAALRARIKTQFSAWLLNLFNQGYFAGATPAESYFVICDDTNNPQVSIDAGFLFIDIGVATKKPAEFIVFSFQQMQMST
ncbi:MAG: hypothetical protein DRP09_16325 [Candidatus Thorarchaeota archaeon]|nr:MAG: hypothetical protein DRP09_16325 [Candidatus Thorarchaeota archaeon]